MVGLDECYCGRVVVKKGGKWVHVDGGDPFYCYKNRVKNVIDPSMWDLKAERPPLIKLERLW